MKSSGMSIKDLWPVVPLTLLWLVLRMLQVGPPFMYFDTGVFLMPGLLSALIVVFLYLGARPGVQRWLVATGYVVTLPIAFLAALGSGMVLPALLGVTVI